MTINQQCIAEIQKEFPKHTKQAYSLAQRTSETGVELCPRAKEIERSIRGKISPSKDMHRFQCSLRVRVSEEQHTLVKQLIEQEGRFPTVQSWLVLHITRMRSTAFLRHISKRQSGEAGIHSILSSFLILKSTLPLS